MSDIKTRHSKKFIDADLERWSIILREVTTWPEYATSYRAIAHRWVVQGVIPGRSQIKRMCRDWPHHAIVLDALIAANRKRYLKR